MARERISDDASQLPRGRHGLTHGAVVEHQRQRMIRAVPSAVREKGFVALTVEDIASRAGVSRRTFYENFRDKEDCFVTSYRQHAQELVAVVGGAAAAGSDWHERTRFGLRAMLRHLAERPDLVYMAVIEVNAAGPAALAMRDEAVGLLAALIGDEAFVTAPEPAPRLLLRTIGGSILQLIYASVLAGRDRELEELLPTIMYIVLVAIDGPQDAAIRAGLLSARPGSETG
jgi:AcrR family transcriptional regulator